MEALQELVSADEDEDEVSRREWMVRRARAAVFMPEDENAAFLKPADDELKVTILDHFEGLIKKVIIELNDVEGWKTETARIESQAELRAVFDFFGQAIDVMKMFCTLGNGRARIDGLLQALHGVQTQVFALPITVGTGSEVQSTQTSSPSNNTTL